MTTGQPNVYSLTCAVRNKTKWLQKLSLVFSNQCFFVCCTCRNIWKITYSQVCIGQISTAAAIHLSLMNGLYNNW